MEAESPAGLERQRERDRERAGGWIMQEKDVAAAKRQENQRHYSANPVKPEAIRRRNVFSSRDTSIERREVSTFFGLGARKWVVAARHGT